jgi:hypothetical protein
LHGQPGCACCCCAWGPWLFALAAEEPFKKVSDCTCWLLQQLLSVRSLLLLLLVAPSAQLLLLVLAALLPGLSSAQLTMQ